jgi:hypothetical protein
MAVPGVARATEPNSMLSAKEKSQLRRMQVRKAQIQHRVRKANYVKQLEVDIFQLRDLIIKVERECASLAKENQAIRHTLVTSNKKAAPLRLRDEDQDQVLLQVSVLGNPSPGAQTPSQLGQDDYQRLHELAHPPSSPFAGDRFSGINVNDLTVTLQVDEELGTAYYKITSSASPEPSHQPSRIQNAGIEDWQLTPEQEQNAINFILS